MKKKRLKSLLKLEQRQRRQLIEIMWHWSKDGEGIEPATDETPSTAIQKPVQEPMGEILRGYR